jgi:hypothetical protein
MAVSYLRPLHAVLQLFDRQKSTPRAELRGFFTKPS